MLQQTMNLLQGPKDTFMRSLIFCALLQVGKKKGRLCFSFSPSELKYDLAVPDYEGQASSQMQMRRFCTIGLVCV